MNVLAFLIPVSLILGGIGLVFFIWTIRSGQYNDPDGDAARILMDDTPPEDRG
jgi:cbb3-type cytochrome oxidase maturation protein